MPTNPDSASHLRVTKRVGEPARDVVLLGVAGELDACSAVGLREAVLGTVTPADRGVVLDLADVTLVSAAGIRALGEVAATLANTGRRLALANCRHTVGEIVRQIGAPLALVNHGAVAAALAAVRDETTTPDRTVEPSQGLALLRERARHLPGALRTRPLIAGAVSELRDRYDLPDSDSAFLLLRLSSQQYNLKIRLLALAFLNAPPAHPDQQTWFPGRVRDTAPPVPFADAPRGWRGNHGAFLSAVLTANMSIMDSEAGYLQLADRFVGGLRLESQQGLPSRFTERFTYVDEPLPAFGSGAQSTRNLNDEPDATARSIFRTEGFRSMHSLPLLDEDGQPIGIVSTLHKDDEPRTSSAQRTELRAVARQSSAWLDWYHRTIMLDALERLHNVARTSMADRH